MRREGTTLVFCSTRGKVGDSPVGVAETIFGMTSPRRLEDRIRELCARSLSAEGEEWRAIVEDLRKALREHSEYMRKMAAENLGRKKPKS